MKQRLTILFRSGAACRRGGRDHYPRAGKISTHGVAASFYRALGIDNTWEYPSPDGCPAIIVRHGKVIPGLFA